MQSIRLDLGHGAQVHPWWPTSPSATRSAITSWRRRNAALAV